MAEHELPDDYTLGEARDWARARAEKGVRCPCCTQMVKVYQRRLTSVGARTMIMMWRLHGFDWVHVPTLLKTRLPAIAHQGGYATLGQHWGLIEELLEKREDGGRVGWWRLTDLGEQYVRNKTTISMHARVYDNRCLAHLGEQVSIVDALGTKFNYQELMEN